MTDTAESVRRCALEVDTGSAYRMLRRYADLLERIEKAPKATISMVATNQGSGKSDAVATGTYLHGEDETLLNMTGQRVALVQVEK